jgi:hypothetical protein
MEFYYYGECMKTLLDIAQEMLNRLVIDSIDYILQTDWYSDNVFHYYLYKKGREDKFIILKSTRYDNGKEFNYTWQLIRTT